MASPSQLRVISRIAIVGAGPSGLATAKYLLAEKKFDQIVIYEARPEVAGLWDYGPDVVKPPPTQLKIPQVDPTYQVGDSNDFKHILTPLYDNLETNIPRGLMAFSDLEWPAHSYLFPHHKTVFDYISAYSNNVRRLIRFRTRIEKIDKAQASSHSEHPSWIVRSRAHDGSTATETYDAVVIAAGHFDVPFIPEIPGLEEWSKQHPGSITHSILFQSSEVYRNKKVLLVGGGSSGVDIADHIATTCSHPLLHSQRSESFLPTSPDSKRLPLPNVTRIIASTRSVEFADGHVEDSIDAIVFCTGYLYFYPFLQGLQPALITDGTRVEHTYQHLFYTPDPTLAFPVLQMRVIPFAMAEAQAAVIARVWTGRLQLPCQERMEQWEVQRIKDSGSGKAFHRMLFPQDADYINMMHDWAVSAEREGEVGKTPPRWGPKEYYLRERFGMIRKAYRNLGEERLKVRSLEELGYDFEKWQAEQEEISEG